MQELLGTDGSFCPTGEPIGSDLQPSIPPPSVSYIIRNIGKPIAILITCVRAGFLLGLFFDPEDGDDKFLRNVG
jgi:hypothetical protein